MEYENEANWYVVHTYSGYENIVADSIFKLIDSNNLGENILRVEIPLEEDIVEKNGKKKTIQRKKFPAYVFVKAILNKQIWFLITNIRGATGFCGPGGKPLPLTNEEVKRMGLELIEAADLDIKVGDNVRIISGALESFIGEVMEINFERQKVKVSVSMFDRPTPVELDFNVVEKI
jgi:transcriptional antiterminator NusG